MCHGLLATGLDIVPGIDLREVGKRCVEVRGFGGSGYGVGFCTYKALQEYVGDVVVYLGYGGFPKILCPRPRTQGLSPKPQALQP